MPTTLPPAPSPSPALRTDRDLTLDAARALAVAAMVLGHTLDGTLSPLVRATPAVQTYWTFRGLTAPLFLMVAGWAVVTASARLTGGRMPVLRARLPRVLLLLALGLLLRLPTWGMGRLLAGDEAVRAHFLAFDALHCVGAGLLIGALVLDASPRRHIRAALFAALAAGLPLASAEVWRLLSGAPLFVRQALGGGTSPFPITPWAGYFCVGALLGLVPWRRFSAPGRTGLLAAAGALLTAGAAAAGVDLLNPTNPPLFFSRTGQILLILSLVSLFADRVGRVVAPLGRASLGVYLAHLPVVYGWGSTPGLSKRLGPTLSLTQGLVLGVALLSVSYAATLLVRRTKAWLAQKLRWKRATTGSMPQEFGAGRAALKPR